MIVIDQDPEAKIRKRRSAIDVARNGKRPKRPKKAKKIAAESGNVLKRIAKRTAAKIMTKIENANATKVLTKAVTDTIDTEKGLVHQGIHGIEDHFAEEERHQIQRADSKQ